MRGEEDVGASVGGVPAGTPHVRGEEFASVRTTVPGKGTPPRAWGREETTCTFTGGTT